MTRKQADRSPAARPLQLSLGAILIFTPVFGQQPASVTQGTVTKHVYQDTNGNGVQDVGEPDLAGVEVSVTDNMMTVQTANTNATGDVSFTVPAGSFTCDVNDATLPPGLVLTTGNDPHGGTVPGGGTVGSNVGYQPTAPTLTASKSSAFNPATDANDGDGALSPGDTLSYTVVIQNTGPVDALAVVFNDTPDANTTLIAGSVMTTQGAVITGNNAGDTSVSVDIGTCIFFRTQTLGSRPRLHAYAPAGLGTQPVERSSWTIARARAETRRSPH